MSSKTLAAIKYPAKLLLVLFMLLFPGASAFSAVSGLPVSAKHPALSAPPTQAALSAPTAPVALAKSAAPAIQKRVVHFTYSTEIGPVASDSGPVHVFIPLPVNNAQQRVLQEEITASIPGEVEVEDAYGNRYWHGYLAASNNLPISVALDVTVERSGTELTAPIASGELTRRERAELERYMAPNKLVLVGAPILDPIRAEIHDRVNSDNPALIARGIYDWVVDNVEYKKVGTGWGNGDTYWACTERYGNCTDFHALFISLARSEGIPARFEIGFPLPEDRPAGQIGGYHCWVQFYLPETGWFPIDASEAFKHPESKEYFYGSHPTNRIHFSTGRDLTLGAAHQAQPLNYFIYPHVEVGGKPYTGTISKRFSFRKAATGAGNTASMGDAASSAPDTKVAQNRPE